MRTGCALRARLADDAVPRAHAIVNVTGSPTVTRLGASTVSDDVVQAQPERGRERAPDDAREHGEEDVSGGVAYVDADGADDERDEDERAPFVGERAPEAPRRAG